MKAKAFLLAAVLFATGTSVCLAANDNKNDDKAKKECRMNKKCDGQKCDAFNPFEGLNLTENQKAKLNDIKAECSKKRDEVKKENQQKQRVDRQQMKRDYLAKVKGILTPEQYVTFLENMAINQHAMGPGRHHDMKKGKMDRNGQKDSPRRDKDMKKSK